MYRFQRFPQRLYKGEARLTVDSEAQLEAALRDGWSERPGADTSAQSVETAEPESIEEAPAPAKRGPGRPRKDASA